MAAREFSFTSFQASNPTAPPPGDRLDGEFDRLAKTITALPPPTPVKIGKNQLEPGLFDQIGTAILVRVEALATGAKALLAQAHAAATGALAAAGIARAQNALAQDAAQRSTSEAQDAASSAAAAAASANAAQASATDASNDASHADGAAALAEDWADVSVAWAEHMPDPIPPNILAVMGITGDHWSSRWWANQAAQTVAGLFPASWTVGSVPFATSVTQLGQDAAHLFWDDANNRLGVGTATPGSTLEAVGEIQSSGNAAALTVNRRDTNVRAWSLYSAAGNLQLYNQQVSAEKAVILGNGNFGIGTPAPVTLLANTATATADQAGSAVVPGGFTWRTAASAGYAAAIYNTFNSTAGHGLLVRSEFADQPSRILTLNSAGVDVAVVLGNGSVGIGTATPGSKLTVNAVAAGYATEIYNAFNDPTAHGLRLRTTYGDQPSRILTLNAAGVDQAVIMGNGGMTLGTPTGGNKGAGTLNCIGAYANNVLLTSDADLKTDIEPLLQALALVEQIQPQTFRWKPLPDQVSEDDPAVPVATMPPGFTEQLNRGFLAGDVAKILGGKDDAIDLGAMTAILWQAVREMSDKIAVLEGKP